MFITSRKGKTHYGHQGTCLKAPTGAWWDGPRMGVRMGGIEWVSWEETLGPREPEYVNPWSRSLCGPAPC